MMRNAKLLKIISIMLAIMVVASGFCYYRNTVPVEASGPDSAIQQSTYAIGDEIISKRTETAKTYYLGGNSYAVDVSMGAIHYKNNYRDNSEQWKDIDLTFDKNNRITKTPYDLIVDTENYSLTLKDKKTGQISSLRLMKIGNKEIKNIQKPAMISQGKVQWKDIDTDLDLAITAENDRVSFDWIVKSENAPHQVEFEIQNGGIPVTFKGQDAENKPVEVKVQKTVNKVVESIEKGGKYPKTINPDYQLASGGRDCAVDWTGSDWEFYSNAGDPMVGYWGSALCKSGMGLSWITDIPYQAYITSANIKFTAYYSDSVGTVRSKITGQKLPTPYNFTNLANYQTQRGTVVGGADNTKITSAQVNWDSIGSWTADSEYTTPDISSIVQEIVNDPGWDSSVKAVVLFWDDHDGGSSTTDNARRCCYSREDSSTKAAKLHVEYTTDYYLYNGMRWSAGSATYNLSSIGDATWRAAIDSAAAAWNGAGANFSFTNDSNSSHTWSTYYDAGTGDLMLTSWSWSGDSIVDCDTKINTYHTFSTDGSAYDIQSAACHEFGHWLSLDHVDPPFAVMYEWFYPGEIRRTLSIGDINGINFVYP